MRKCGNEEEVTRIALAEGLLVYSTLAKFEMKKRCIEAVRRIRKKTERFKRGEGEILMKKGCKEGGVSL